MQSSNKVATASGKHVCYILHIIHNRSRHIAAIAEPASPYAFTKSYTCMQCATPCLCAWECMCAARACDDADQQYRHTGSSIGAGTIM